MPEPQPISGIGPSALARILAGIRERGLTSDTGPIDDTPRPDEPGHPEYHRQQRAAFALARWNTAVPHRYRQATATHPDIQTWADRAAHNHHDAGFLVLNGNIGTGKTHQAYGALRRIAEAGPRRFEMIATTAPDLYGRLRPGGSDKGSEHELKQYARIQLLLIDDLGTEKLSEFTEEATYRIVNERYNACLPLIITTNLMIRTAPGNAQSLADRLGDRLASRLAQTAHTVTLTGPDLRRHHQDAS
jgi:DNA replication protein DnaC